MQQLEAAAREMRDSGAVDRWFENADKRVRKVGLLLLNLYSLIIIIVEPLEPRRCHFVSTKRSLLPKSVVSSTRNADRLDRGNLLL